MKYVVPYLRARRMNESPVKDESLREGATQEKLDEIDELFMRLECISPPPTFVENILTSVKMLSHTFPLPLTVCEQDNETNGLIAHVEHHQPS